MINEIQKSYLAGMIDGEGSITIKKVKNYKYKPSQNKFYFHLNVHLTNSDKRIIDLLEKYFGGYVNVRDKDNKKWKCTWRWSISNITAYNFLKMIFPYLILKKEQALTAINFQEKNIMQGFRGIRITEKENYERIKSFEEIKLLNKKGV